MLTSVIGYRKSTIPTLAPPPGTLPQLPTGTLAELALDEDLQAAMNSIPFHHPARF